MCNTSLVEARYLYRARNKQKPTKQKEGNLMAIQTFTAKPGTAGSEFLAELADKCNTLKASTPASGWEGGLEKILASIMPDSKGKMAQVFKDLGAEVVTPEMVENTEPIYAIIAAIVSGDPQEVISVYYVGLSVGRGILGLPVDGDSDTNAHSPGAS